MFEISLLLYHLNTNPGYDIISMFEIAIHLSHISTYQISRGMIFSLRSNMISRRLSLGQRNSTNPAAYRRGSSTSSSIQQCETTWSVSYTGQKFLVSFINRPKFLDQFHIQAKNSWSVSYTGQNFLVRFYIQAKNTWSISYTGHKYLVSFIYRTKILGQFHKQAKIS